MATPSATITGGVTTGLQVTPIAVMALDVEIRPGPGRQEPTVLKATGQPLVGRELERLTPPTMMVGPAAVVARLLAVVTPVLREVAGVLGVGGPFRGATTVLGSWRPGLAPLLRRRLPVLQVLLRHPVRPVRPEEAEVDRLTKRQDVLPVMPDLEEGLGVADTVLPGAPSSSPSAIPTPVRVKARIRPTGVLPVGVVLCRVFVYLCLLLG